jgi:hypothetical protein
MTEHDSNQPRKLGWSERHAVKQAAETETLDLWRRMARSLTELTARFTEGDVINGVLEVGTFTLPASGELYKSFDWPVAAGCVEIGNLSAANMTVQAAGVSADGTAPGTGRGVYVLPAGACRVINLASHVVTVYGAASAQFTIQASTRGGFVSSGLIGVNGGGV